MNKLSNTTCLGSTDIEKLKRPLPNNFEAFLPWAVRHLQLNVEVVIARVTQEEYVSIRGSEMSKSKVKGKAKTEQRAKDDSNDESISWQQIRLEQEDAVSIQVTYDNADNLIKIKFNNNWSVPREVLKIITLIIKFYPNLTALTINKGLNMAVVHEIHNLLPVSNITDVCLDNTFVKEANYYILLQTPGNLKYLSLARCCINDVAIKNLAINLHYGTKASKTLCLLNLASNRITDLGARHLADALKTNRKLCYLNLSDNAITDYGAICILNTLEEFMLTNEELLAYKTRHMAYLRERNALITKIAKELKLSDMGGKLARRKPMKPLLMPLRKKSKAMEREHSIKGISEGKSFINTLN